MALAASCENVSSVLHDQASSLLIDTCSSLSCRLLHKRVLAVVICSRWSFGRLNPDAATRMLVPRCSYSVPASDVGMLAAAGHMDKPTGSPEPCHVPNP